LAATEDDLNWLIIIVCLPISAVRVSISTMEFARLHCEHLQTH
jgi:hypothetical protein